MNHNTMRIETAANILKLITEGHDTVSKLIDHTHNHSIGYQLKTAEAEGLIEKQIKTGQRTRPYKLTEKGKRFLALFP